MLRTGKLWPSPVKGGYVRIWNLPSHRLERCWVAQQTDIHQLAFSQVGDLLATCGGDGAAVWNLATLDQIAMIRDLHALDVAFTPTGHELLTADGEGRLSFWNVQSGNLRTRVSGHIEAISAVKISPNGKWIATACREGILKLWDAESLQVLSSQVAHLGAIRAIAFSPSGNVLATAGHDDFRIHLWEVPEDLEAEIKKRAAEWGRYPTTRPRTPRGARCLELLVY